ncbi:hypothetical protein AMS68_000344 [Peltaster fructicola]|uniref:tRNA dimethylallyltransferase n=1 Tax=Peltaster fructicola TaxID=286661 RepID=A0A6H0XJC8_9PEZI|nr:hypothetical protein AMS68_000344 [Peltaster fructicola]
MISTHTRIPSNPLITIVGATGTGKSQLAVELAKRFNGEVINGDAMQLYSGMPIITNKITSEQQYGIPHHLLGCIDLDEPTWVVSTFVKRALEVIQEIRARGKLPILVGGTHYYTQSLLFNEALATEDDENTFIVNTDTSPEKQFPILAEPTETLLAELKKVDPVSAGKWHPKDRRKIQRSLMIFLQTGTPASQIYAKQQLARDELQKGNEHDAERTGSLMRFPTLVFWVHTEAEALRFRLDGRVETMLDNGLLEEVDQLQQHGAKELAQGKTVDETRGIWVSIGYKEFKSYHEALKTTTDEKALSAIKAEAIERTKVANRQYAKRQVRWIRIKLVNALAQAGSCEDFYLLDSSDASAFDEFVVQPAAKLTEQFLKGEQRPAPSTVCPAAAVHLSARDEYDHSKTVVRVVQHCELCDLTCATDQQWNDHVKSKKHRRLASKARAAVLSTSTSTSDDLLQSRKPISS